MSIVALNFNGVDLISVDRSDGQLWVTSADLAKALDYKTVTGITKLYNRNKSEFTGTMTALVDIEPSKVGRTLNSGAFRAETRIFSIRGCHLIAMFARTKIAQDFRVWALNVLDAHIASQSSQDYQLGDLQNMRDENRARYAVGFTVASGGGKTLSNWKHEKRALDTELQVIDNLMQPLLTGFNDAKLIK